MSDSEMLRAAQAEVARLEAELAETPAYKKLQLAKQVVALYRDEQSTRFVIKPKPGPSVMEAAGLALEAFHRMQDAASQTKTARIEAAAVNFLKQRRSRATSGELLEAMKSEGIEITGKEPNKALSAYLSNSKALNNIRELGGYGLVEWGTAKGPDLLTETGA